MVDAMRFFLSNTTHFGIQKDLIVIAITMVLTITFAVDRFNKIEM